MPILQWLNRDKSIKVASRVPYRLLKVDPKLSYGDENTENMIIQGDNLDALKALLPYYAGKVKCVYIDPPYNTRSAFETYEDSLEHTKWLEMMYPRLELLSQFLSEDDGIILISINDDEGHYLKVICDEIFGRQNFITSLVWNYEGNTDNQAKIINYHEYILVYSKSGKVGSLNVIDPNISENSKINNPEIRNTIIKNGIKNPPKEVFIPAGFPTNFESGVIKKNNVNFPKYSDDIEVKHFKTATDVYAKTGWSSREILEKFIENGLNPVKDSKNQDTIFEMTPTGAIEYVKKRSQEKGHFVSVLRGFGTTNQMRLFLEKLELKFSFPKPINLISYLIDAFTDKDSLILDSFAGSGTTAHAVLKLNHEKNTNRKFIIIEKEASNSEKVIIPRIKSVVNGSKEADIDKCGGGFKFYHLGEEVFDEYGQINHDIKFEHLAAHIWFSETHTPLNKKPKTPLLGVHKGTAYYLLYNGILGDKRPNGGNVLTSKVFESLTKHDGPKVIYGETSRIGAVKLEENGIIFKQTPYDVKAR